MQRQFTEEEKFKIQASRERALASIQASAAKFAEKPSKSLGSRFENSALSALKCRRSLSFFRRFGYPEALRLNYSQVLIDVMVDLLDGRHFAAAYDLLEAIKGFKSARFFTLPAHSDDAGVKFSKLIDIFSSEYSVLDYHPVKYSRDIWHIETQKNLREEAIRYLKFVAYRMLGLMANILHQERIDVNAERHRFYKNWSSEGVQFEREYVCFNHSYHVDCDAVNAVRCAFEDFEEISGKVLLYVMGDSGISGEDLHNTLRQGVAYLSSRENYPLLLRSEIVLHVERLSMTMEHCYLGENRDLTSFVQAGERVAAAVVLGKYSIDIDYDAMMTLSPMGVKFVLSEHFKIMMYGDHSTLMQKNLLNIMKFVSYLPNDDAGNLLWRFSVSPSLLKFISWLSACYRQYDKNKIVYMLCHDGITSRIRMGSFTRAEFDFICDRQISLDLISEIYSPYQYSKMVALFNEGGSGRYLNENGLLALKEAAALPLSVLDLVGHLAQSLPALLNSASIVKQVVEKGQDRLAHLFSATAIAVDRVKRGVFTSAELQIFLDDKFTNDRLTRLYSLDEPMLEYLIHEKQKLELALDPVLFRMIQAKFIDLTYMKSTTVTELATVMNMYPGAKKRRIKDVWDPAFAKYVENRRLEDVRAKMKVFGQSGRPVAAAKPSVWVSKGLGCP